MKPREFLILFLLILFPPEFLRASDATADILKSESKKEKDQY